uniref:IMV membrane protein n=1 Tax=Rousettus bat poxvirus TaxID=3141933 RepID=A0AAU7E225_9POXV
MSFLNDEKIYTYCDHNPRDPRCRCLLPDPSVAQVGRELRLPYYCWYEPCKRADALIPSALRSNIDRCNVTTCTISLGDVAIKNGVLEVSNACLASSAAPAAFQVRYFNRAVLPPILDPPVLLLAFAALALFVLIR